MQIALFIFAVLTVAGAWAGWRRSPLYSRKVTLKLAGAVLLTAAATVGVTLVIVSGPFRLSAQAQAILAAVAVVAVGTGATGLLVRITDGHMARTAPSVRIVTTERHKIQRWIWRIAAYLAICAAAALVLPSAWIWAPLTLGGLVLLGCGPALVALYMRARRLDLGMSATVAAPWAYWRYSPAEWQIWARNELEWERSHAATVAWLREWRKTLKAAAMMALIFLGSAWLMLSGSAAEKLAVAGGGMALVVAMAAGVNWANRRAPDRRYRRLLRAPPEALFGDEGVFCNGEFSPWILSGSYLVEATGTTIRPPAWC